MSSLLRSLTAALLLPLALPAGALAASNDEVAAHRAALDLAGAFSNDGFKLRDGNWAGKLAPKKVQLLQVNLYAGNQYWFSLGTTPGAKKVSLTLFDESGKPLAAEPFAEEGKAAAGFAPQVSGPYYLRIVEEEGTPAVFCLVYSYK